MRLSAFQRRACFACAAVAATVAGGCKSDLNQQLLERELRYQEDQIYYLQDELAEKQARLSTVAGENESLRRQLGVNAADDPAPARGGRPIAPRVPSGTLVPPALEVPDVSPLPAPRGGPPVELTPPSLEGVPSLPAEPVVPPKTRGISFPPPAAAAIDPAARPIDGPIDDRSPALVRTSYEEPVGGEPVRLVIKPLDDMAGRDGIALAVEPRDATERLVAGLTGDVTVTAYDGALAQAPPIARWTISSADALARFRPTGRHRGIALALPWQGTSPSGDHVRLHVQTATATGVLDSEALIEVR